MRGVVGGCAQWGFNQPFAAPTKLDGKSVWAGRGGGGRELGGRKALLSLAQRCPEVLSLFMALA